MRFIFVDEAGISANEAYTVLVGIIVDADGELVRAEELTRQALGSVPEQHRAGFQFSAKAVWGDPKLKADWLISDRLRLLCNMMAVPKRMRLPIAVSVIPRSVDYGLSDLKARADYQHAASFAQCMSRADKFIRERGRDREVGTVVAENIDPHMRRGRSLFMEALRDKATVFGAKAIHRTAEEKRLGYITQETEMRVSNIRKTMHYVQKGEEPLIDVADACAYGIRAYLNRTEFGDRFIQAIGIEMPLEDWGVVGGFAVMVPAAF